MVRIGGHQIDAILSQKTHDFFSFVFIRNSLVLNFRFILGFKLLDEFLNLAD